MGLHMAVCHGPVDSLDQIYVGERSLVITQQTSNATVEIDKNGLFGGDEKEGGIVGTLDIAFGANSQTANSYLLSKFGAATPAFRGVMSVVFRAATSPSSPNYIGPSGGGYLAAMSPYPKPWAFEVTDIPGGSFNPTKQNINGGANGGHIIYDCLTDHDWGLGIAASDLDSTSFTDVTNTLHTENFSLSLVYAQQSTMEDFIKEILTHINAVLYTDRTTGKFILKLIRDDFTVGSLPIFNETNIASMVSFERPAFAELVNEITINYRKQGDFKDSSITVQDLASVQAQGGIVSQAVAFPGIDTADNASLVGLRELKQSSTPLARCKIVANREAWGVNPGDVIKVSWEAYDISQLVMRVISVDYGTLEDGLVGIELLEDIFGLPSNTYLVPVDSGWTDEVGPPVASANTKVLEVPYFLIETALAQEEINQLVDESALLQSLAELPPVATFAYQLHTRINPVDYAQVTSGEFIPAAQLVGALDRTTKTSISIKNFTGAVGAVVIGGIAYLNDEVLRIDSVDLVLGLMDVGRGYLDTIPRSHLTDDVIYFAENSDNGIDPTIYTISDVVDAKILPQTSLGTLDIGSVTAETVTMVGRRTKPYPPAQIEINNVYFPTTIESSSVTVTWAHQDRTQQLVLGGDDWYTVSLGSAEEGVKYNVRYYNNDTLTLLFAEEALTGTSSVFAPTGAIGTNFNMRIEVDAIRDGTEINYDPFVFIFSYSKPTEVRTTMAGDTRTLMNGDRRVLES